MKIMHLISRWNERKTFCLRIMRLGKIIDYTFLFYHFWANIKSKKGDTKTKYNNTNNIKKLQFDKKVVLEKL